MKCVICGKKACMGFDTWPGSRTFGLCKEHMTEANIWRLQRQLDDGKKQSEKDGQEQQTQDVS